MPLKQYRARTMCSINILRHALRNHKSEMERMLKLDKLTQQELTAKIGKKIKTESL